MNMMSVINFSHVNRIKTIKRILSEYSDFETTSITDNMSIKDALS